MLPERDEIRVPRLALWGLVVVCFFTFFVNNGVFVPDIMESRNLITAREMVQDGNWLVPTMNGELRFEKPPLPTWCTAIAYACAPASVEAQRVPAGIMGALLTLFFFLFAKRVMRTNPVVPTLILLTCYNVVLMGRTASWDIYTHAFMMGAIYWLSMGLLNRDRYRWWRFIGAGVMMGLSIMSKGPVSLFALFLPYILAFCLYYRPSARGIAGPLVAMAIIAVVIGCWWYVYIYATHYADMARVAGKESGAWMDHNVRPWWYYWKFFLESGIWSLLLLTAIFAVFMRGCRRSKAYLFSLAWMFAALILLSCMPEKKTRYLLPMLIPASYLMGVMLNVWKGFSFRQVRASRVLFRINAWILAVVLLVVPVAAWITLVTPGHMSVWIWVVVTIGLIGAAAGCAIAAIGLGAHTLVWSVAILFCWLELFGLPAAKPLINNPEMKSIALSRKVKELDGIPFYYTNEDGMRIELVYAAGRKIRPVSASNADSIRLLLPMAILTHKSAGEALPQELWQDVDSIHIDTYDDNRRPKGTRRYSGDFIYNLTLLKPKQK